MEKAAPLLCSMKQSKSYWFGKKSELVNDIIFIFGLIISFICRNINDLFRCFDVSFTKDSHLCEHLHEILSVVLPKGSWSGSEQGFVLWEAAL